MLNLLKNSSLKRTTSAATIFFVSLLSSMSAFAAPLTLDHGGVNQPTSPNAAYTTPIVQGDGDSATITNNTTANGINITTGGISTTDGALSFTNKAGDVVVTGGISSTSGDLDFVNQSGVGTTAANVNLGSNTSSSVSLQGGTLTGNVTMNNNSQTLTFVGGNLNGNILGSGSVIVDSTNKTTLGGDVTASTITINAGKTLSNSGDKAINANIQIGNNATFDFGGGSVVGQISGSTNSTLLFSEAVDINANNPYISPSTTFLHSNPSLGLVHIKDNVSITGNTSVVSDSVLIATGKSLTYSAISLISNVEILSGAKLILSNVGYGSGSFTNKNNHYNGSTAYGDGSIEISQGSGNVSINGIIGSSDNIATTKDERLASLNLLSSSSATLRLNSTLNTTQTNLSFGSNLILEGGVVVNSDILSSQPKASNAGTGTVSINGSGVDFNGDIGSSTHYLTKLDLDSASTLTLDGTNDIYVDSIELESGSTLSLAGSAVKATNGINGEAANQGTLTLSAARTLTNNDFQIGSSAAIATLNVDAATIASQDYNIRANNVNILTGDSLTLAAGSSSGSKTTVTGTVNVATGGSLVVNNNTTVTGSILGSTDGSGTLNVAASQTYSSAAAIGSTANSLATVSLASSSTLNSSHNLDATNVSLAANSTLNINGGTLVGAINGVTGGSTETVNFNTGTNTTLAAGTTIGSNIDDVNIANGASVTANANISAARVDVGTGASGALSVGTGVTVSSAVNLADNSTLNLDNAASVTGAINGVASGQGKVSVGASDSVTQGSSIGATIKIKTLELGGGSTYTVGANTLKADEAVLSSGATMNIANGALEATIKGSSNNVGTVNLTANRTVASGTFLGASGAALNQLNLSASAIVGLNESVVATTTALGNAAQATLAASKSITGNVTLANAASTLVLSNGSSVVGDINGATATNQGALNIASNAAVSLGGNVGATRALNSVIVSDGATLTNGVHQLRVDGTNGSATLGTGSTLVIGTGAVSGNAINGSGAARGRVLFTENNSIAAGTKLGSTNDTRLSAVDVAYGKTVTISEDVRATTLTVGVAYNESTPVDATSLTLNTDADFTGNAVIGENSKLTLSGSSSVSGTIDGSAANKGVLEINSNGNTIALGANVGATNSLTTVSVLGTTTLNAGANTITAENISLAAGSTLSTRATITGAIRGAANGAGRLTITDSVTLGSSATIGQGESAKLNDLFISGGTLTTAANVRANTVTVGNNNDVAFNVGAGTTVDAAVTIANDSTLTLNNNSVVAGAINGEGANEGRLAISSNSTFSAGAGIGQATSLRQITVGQNATFNTGDHNVSARTISVGTGSTLNLGDNAMTVGTGGGQGIVLTNATMNFSNSDNAIVGNILSEGGSTLNLGSGAHTVNGNLTIAETDTVKVTANLDGYGFLSAGGGVANVAQGASLDVTIDSRLAYGAAGSSYDIIIGGAGSDINAVGDSNIEVNALGSNRMGLLTFKSSVSDNKLIMTVNRDSASEVSANGDIQRSYSAINQVGNSATGELRAVQDFVVLAQSTTAGERQTVLESIAQNDVGTNQAVFAGITSSINVIENRMSNLSLSAPSYKVTDARGNKVKALDKSAAASSARYGSDSSNEAVLGRSVWGQVFGTNAKQSNSGGFNGYDAQSRGLSFGIDQEIEKDLLVGAALSINNTDISSTNGAKKVNVDSYQLTLYGEKKYDEYFVDGFVSGALNRFESDRRIALVGKTASVSYDGYSYSAKARVGMINRLENGFDIIPHAGLVYAYNSATDYQENGAGTLNLSVNNSSAEMLIGDVGVALSYDAEFFKYKLRPELKVSYGHDFMGNEQVSSANFVGQGALLNATNSKSDRNMIRLGVGTDIYSVDQFTLNASYLLEKRETYQSHTGLIKAKYNF